MTASASTTPARPVLLINPRSGGGKARRFDLVTRCRAQGVEPVVMKDGDDLAALAGAAVSSGADVIGMAGGDGSQGIVASIASRHDIPTCAYRPAHATTSRWTSAWTGMT